VHDDETPNPGAEAGDADEIEMPQEPASVDAATTRRDMALIDYANAVDKAEAATNDALMAHFRYGEAKEAYKVAFDQHMDYLMAETRASDNAAALDAASDKAEYARAEAYVAEVKARDAYTKAIAEGDPAAIAEAKQALSAAEALHKGTIGYDDALRAAAEDAAEAAKMADIAEDAAQIRNDLLLDAEVDAKIAAQEAENAKSEAYDELYRRRVEFEEVKDALEDMEELDRRRAEFEKAKDANKDGDPGEEGMKTLHEVESQDNPFLDPANVDETHIEMPPEPAREQAVEPPGSEAAPIVEGEASSRLMDGGVGASPTENSRDEAFSGNEGEGAPDATAATDTAVGGASVGGVAVGDAGDRFSIGETNKDLSEPILGPLGDAGDAAVEDETTNVYTDSDGKLWVDGDDYNRTVGEYNDLLEHTEGQQKVEALADAAEDVGESVEDFVGGIPFVGDDLGGALREGYDVVEDVVDHADDPAVVQDVDPWG
jgi:hypothetical protein